MAAYAFADAGAAVEATVDIDTPADYEDALRHFNKG